MIRHIYRCDASAIRTILTNIAQEPNGIRRSTMLQDIVDQVGDGGNFLSMYLFVKACSLVQPSEQEMNTYTYTSIDCAQRQQT